MNSETNRRRPLSESHRILVFLPLFVLAVSAWSQQISPYSPNLVADSALSAALEVAASPKQQLPEQPALGSIHGVVVDPGGAVYAGVRIELTQATSLAQPARTVISDADGRFNISDVPTGAFMLTVSSDGFATQEISGVLRPGQSYETQAIILLVSRATSEVKVTASEQDVVQEQLKAEEKQRVLGVIPNFYVTYVPNAPPLTSKQKFSLAWKSSVDPVTFLATGAIAGVEQANNDLSGYGQGAQGYGKRYAANYADNFIGTMIGGAILPSLLKQDPRYFYKGTGTTRSRVFYAIATTVICKGDNGHWQANYSSIFGGLAAGGISNLYYPSANRNGFTLTFENAMVGTALGAAQNLFQEFLVRKLTPKIPNYGPPKP